MSALGFFYGIGVGPGEPGLIPVVAWEAMKRCDLIFVPRARSTAVSVARECLPDASIPEDRFREIEFTMDPDRSVLSEHYWLLAEQIAVELRAGKTVAYLTLGDALTYSTYAYMLAALRDCLPGLRYRTFPGVTSYCALAAATDWSLGEGKENVLILPCPEEMEQLHQAIEAHDIVVLMKVGSRWPQVKQLLQKLEIENHCAFGQRVGMSEQLVSSDLAQVPADGPAGYLSTILIRKTKRAKRHAPLAIERSAI